MKLYTKTGDDGSTGLYGGARVGKDDARVCVYGTVDEANAAVGCAAVVASAEMRSHLHDVMRDLFDVGAELSTPPPAQEKLQKKLVTHVDASRVAELEQLIDVAAEKTPPIMSFVLPTGCDAAARLHLARTIVRRAEREVIAFARVCPVRAEVIVYLNRLSDLLFAWARLENHMAGVGDVSWVARK